MIIQRSQLRRVLELLTDEQIVIVEGPRRSGLSTFAAQIQRAALGGARILDMRRRDNRRKLLEPEALLKELEGRILVVDHADIEAEACLDIARISSKRRQRGRVVLVGSNFPTETGVLPRPARIRLAPLSLSEAGRDSRPRHWLRGGYPESLMATDDQAAFSWLGAYAEGIAGSRLAAAGFGSPRRNRDLLAALAEAHGGPINENALAAILGVSRPTVARSVEALVDAGILTFLPSLDLPGGRRSRKAPICYFRDSGLHHSILGLESREALLASPRLEPSWEGYVIAQCLGLLPEGIEAHCYESGEGARLELVLVRPGEEGHGRQARPLLGAAIAWAKKGEGTPRKALYAARAIRPERAYLVLPDAEEKDLPGGFRTIGLASFLSLVSGLSARA